MRKLFLSLGWSALLAIGVAPASAAEIYKLPAGSPELKSAGPLAFGPEGILLIGDTKAAAIVAIQTGDKGGAPSAAKYDVADLPGKVAKALGTDKAQINDLAVNPESGNLYLSVNAGGPKIVKLTANGEIQALTLKDIGFSRVELPNAPEDKVTGEGPRARNNRDTSITDLAWVNGQVIVSGSIAGTASSGVRALNFPFGDKYATSNLEIYHAAHARSEDNAIIRTFVPFNINGEPSVLAGFTCTPLVKFSVSEIAGSDKIKGTTVAELGNRNQPLDMIAYKQDGKDFLLLANSARGVMKVSTANIDRKDGLTQPVRDGGTAGQAFETVAALQGTVQLDKLNDTHAVVLQQVDGSLNLKSIPLP